MTRLLLVLCSAAALAGPAFATDSASPALNRHPIAMSRMAAQHHPIHCTIRHHRRYCHR
jgi:hypothetical protein